MNAPAKEQIPRPTRSGRKMSLVLEAAKRLFLDQGVAATTMEAVAAEAGVSKATLYAYFKSRDELFGAVVEALDDKFTSDLVFGSPSEEFRSKLLRLGRSIILLLLSPQTIAAYRTVVSESSRQPELGEIFYDNGARRLLDRLERLFTQAQAQGQMRPGHPRRAAEQFIGLIRGDLMLRALLGVREVQSASQIDEVVRAGVEIFHRAYRADGEE